MPFFFDLFFRFFKFSFFFVLLFENFKVYTKVGSGKSECIVYCSRNYSSMKSLYFMCSAIHYYVLLRVFAMSSLMQSFFFALLFGCIKVFHTFCLLEYLHFVYQNPPDISLLVDRAKNVICFCITENVSIFYFVLFETFFIIILLVAGFWHLFCCVNS